MLRKKLVAGIVTAALTLSMCLGTGMTVFAGDDPVSLDDARGAVAKNLVMDENVTTPNATFRFTIEKLTEGVTDATGEDVTEYLSMDGPELSIDAITFTKNNTGTTEDGIKTVSGEGRIRKADGGILGPSSFPHAGIYAYKVTETADTYDIEDPTKENMIYSQAEYTVFITIANRANYGGGLKIESIQAMITIDDSGADIEDAKVPSTEPGSSDLAFQNIYSKTGGTGEDGDEWNPTLGALSVSKTVTGKMGDQTKAFDFSLTLYKSATLDMEVAQSGSEYPVYTVTLPGSGTLTYQFDEDTDEITQTFQLKHGEKIVFTDVPVGSKFTLSENNGQKVGNYTTTISGKSDGTEFAEAAGTMTTSNKLVGEGSNYADVENNYSDNPITGIISNNLPFIILICAAVLGFAAYLVVKRHRFVK